MVKMIANNDIMFGVDETTLIKPKKRLENAKDVLRSVIYEDGRSSTKQLKHLWQETSSKIQNQRQYLADSFNFVIEKDDYIMDFFWVVLRLQRLQCN